MSLSASMRRETSEQGCNGGDHAVYGCRINGAYAANGAHDGGWRGKYKFISRDEEAKAQHRQENERRAHRAETTGEGELKFAGNKTGGSTGNWSDGGEPGVLKTTQGDCCEEQPERSYEWVRD